MKALLLVAKETYLRQVKSWSFVAMVFAPFIMAFFSIGLGYLSGSNMNSGPVEIAVISQEKMIETGFSEMEMITLDYTDEAKAKQAIEDEELLGYLKVDVVDNQIRAVYHGNELPDSATESNLQQRLLSLQNQYNMQLAQLTEEQVATLTQVPDYQVRLQEDAGLEKIGKYITFFVLIFLLYILTMIYASTTAQEVASEKGTKIMEVIFSSVPATTYFYGRILGIFMVVGTHLGIYVVGGIASFQYASMATALLTGNSLVSAALTSLDWWMVWFILFGLVLLVVLSALCGSLVVRPEDVNKAIQPVMYLIMAGMFGAIVFGQQAQEHMVVKIGSYLPVFSTFFMPIRLINGWAALWEILLSLSILVATTATAIYFIGKSYAGLILQTDDIGLWKSLKKGFSSK